MSPATPKAYASPWTSLTRVWFSRRAPKLWAWTTDQCDSNPDEAIWILCHIRLPQPSILNVVNHWDYRNRNLLISVRGTVIAFRTQWAKIEKVWLCCREQQRNVVLLETHNGQWHIDNSNKIRPIFTALATSSKVPLACFPDFKCRWAQWSDFSTG